MAREKAARALSRESHASGGMLLVMSLGPFSRRYALPALPAVFLLGTVGATLAVAAQRGAATAAPNHPHLLFAAGDLDSIKARARHPRLAPYATRVIERADWLLGAPPLIPSITRRGAPDPPGEMKGLPCARRLQGRVIDLAMAFTLTGERKYRDKAVELLDDALNNWRIWVDTAHPPPYDLMTGENSLTFGLAYDWL